MVLFGTKKSSMFFYGIAVKNLLSPFIWWVNVANQTVAIDFHSMQKKYGYYQIFSYEHALKYFILCSSE